MCSAHWEGFKMAENRKFIDAYKQCFSSVYEASYDQNIALLVKNLNGICFIFYLLFWPSCNSEPLNDVHFTYICNFAFFRLPTDNLKLTPEQLSVVNYDVDNGVIKIMAFAGNFKKFVIFVCVYV